MGGIINAEPTPSSREYPKIINPSPCANAAISAPIP